MIFPSAIKNQMKLVSLFCFGADWADSFESSILNFFLKIYIYIFFCFIPMQISQKLMGFSWIGLNFYDYYDFQIVLEI